MAKQLKELATGWQTHKHFKEFRELIKDLPTEATPETPVTISVKQEMAKPFCTVAFCQAKKHNKWYMTTRKLVGACFGEQQRGQLVSTYLLHGTFHNFSFPDVPFESKIHGMTFDLKDFPSFL